MRLNRKVEYALIAIKHLGQQAEAKVSSSREISDRYGLPFDMTAQVLRALGRAGILNSEKGVQGGYSLAADLKNVSLYDIHEVIMGPLFLAICLNPEAKSCDLSASCSIQGPVEKLNKKFLSFLKSIALMDLVFDEGFSSADLESSLTSLGGL